MWRKNDTERVSYNIEYLCSLLHKYERFYMLILKIVLKYKKYFFNHVCQCTILKLILFLNLSWWFWFYIQFNCYV